jgi:hypothetical protein
VQCRSVPAGIRSLVAACTTMEERKTERAKSRYFRDMAPPHDYAENTPHFPVPEMGRILAQKFPRSISKSVCANLSPKFARSIAFAHGFRSNHLIFKTVLKICKPFSVLRNRPELAAQQP